MTRVHVSSISVLARTASPLLPSREASKSAVEVIDTAPFTLRIGGYDYIPLTLDSALAELVSSKTLFLELGSVAFDANSDVVSLHLLVCLKLVPNMESLQLARFLTNELSTTPQQELQFLETIDMESLLSFCVPDAYPRLLPDHEHLLECELLPFQKRALAWMLGKEGMNLPGHSKAEERNLPLFCADLKAVDGTRLRVNRLTGFLSLDNDPNSFEDPNPSKGGVLADEMGLGKTVETLALISAHKASEVSFPPVNLDNVFSLPDSDTVSSMKQCIICESTVRRKDMPVECILCTAWLHPTCVVPPDSNSVLNASASTLPQKKRKKHTPPPEYRCTLCTSHGDLLPTAATLIITPSSILSQWQSETKRHAPHLRTRTYNGRHARDPASAQELSATDIVFTTYDVLQREVHLAMGDSTRSRRRVRAYARAGSPLTRVRWWRICLDEAQMVESPATQTSLMARMIPRVHAWCVTGTPMGKGGVADLKGLLLFLGVEVPKGRVGFEALVEDRGLLLDTFRRIMHRNSKENVKGELVLPVQRQLVVDLEFSAVEKAYYEELVETCLNDLKGADDALGREPGVRSARQKGKLIEEGKLKMRSWLLRLRQACCHPQIGDKNKNTLGAKVGTMQQVLRVMLRQANSTAIGTERSLVLLGIKRAHMHEFLKDYARAIAIYQSLLIEIRRRIDQTKAEMQLMCLKEGEPLEMSMEENVDNEGEDGSVADDKEGGRDDMGQLANQITNFKELEHQTVFFIACCYNSLKNEERETQFYEEAEGLRRDILKEFEEEVERRKVLLFQKRSRAAVELSMSKVVAWRKAHAKLPGEVGIVGQHHLKNAERLFEYLHDQWNEALVQWRLRVLELSKSGLENVAEKEVDENQAANSKPSGEEYKEGEDLQVELDELLDVYTYLLSDRGEILSGIHFQAPRAFTFQETEYTPFYYECEETRKRFTLRKGEANLDGVLDSIKYTVENARMPDIERQLASERLASFREGIKIQKQCLESLKGELNKIRKVQNARIEFYKHLQALSKGVDPPERPADVANELEDVQEEILKTESRLIAQMGRAKYLLYLAQTSAPLSDQSTTTLGGEENECLVCKSPFDEGFITECGHLYCEYCLRLWVIKHRKCALCKAPLRDMETQMTKIGSDRPKPPLRDDSDSGKKSAGVIFKEPLLDFARKTEITSLKLDSSSSFGTKTDFMLRHLLHIQQEDPTAKALLFSQWDQVLNVVAMGCERNGIKYVRFEVGKGKDSIDRFRTDPTIKLFMLNAKSQSSGLTLVGATHVFLVEPVVNRGLEMQAINRVHRIGQTKKTYVYRYIVKNTIEERVYAIMGGEGSLSAKTETKSKGGGEFVQDMDVEFCLFGKLRELEHVEGDNSNAGNDLEVVSVDDPSELQVETMANGLTSLQNEDLTRSEANENLEHPVVNQQRVGVGMTGRKRRRNGELGGMRTR
ncbi:SNF2 family N-terminal domain-containing protein [Chytriomyces sp. MP71]|nr:SNF2 family N-terminal domain-containing protein [Chytriomyces sp. MP71]